MKRVLAETFSQAKSQGRAALIGYLPAGYPSVEHFVPAVEVMLQAGMDVIEVGLPYSDPLMDGPVIQKAVESALSQGVNTQQVLNLVKQVAVGGSPVLVMSYWNPIERYGLARFARELSEAGGAGVITPDLTPEESNDWVTVTNENDLARVFLVAPTSTEERLAKIAAVTDGFVYVASLMGVTGVRDGFQSKQQSGSAGASTAIGSSTDDTKKLVERVRKVTDQPIAVGIGVSSAAQVRDIASFADGVIVGSLLVKTLAQAIEESPNDLTKAVSSLTPLVAELAEATKGRN